MRKTKEDSEITRTSLLKAALEVFSRTGFSAATLEDVAREAGLTRGAIYWHFGSKAELYGALLQEYSSRGGEIVQTAAREGGGTREILRRVFIRLLEAVENEPALRAVMEISMFKTERSPELASFLEKQREEGRMLLAGVAEAMRSGVAEGELRPDLDAMEMARAFLGFQNGVMYMWLQDPGAFSLKASAPVFAEVFLNGVSPARD